MKKNFLASLEDLKQTTPIIVCGPARSGTRMITDILNSHENILIQKEMHAKTIEAYFEMIKKINQTFDHYSNIKGHALGSHWQKSKHILSQVFFSTTGKKRTEDSGKTLLYHGIKTPGFERYLEEFENLFERTPPIYIYCMRSEDSVWRSWKSLGFLDDINLFEARYERSLRQAIKIKNKTQGRFILFNLDDYIKSDNKVEFLQTVLFDKLNLKINKSTANLLQSLKNRNSIQKTGSTYIKDEILENEMSHLLLNEKIKDYKKKLKSI